MARLATIEDIPAIRAMAKVAFRHTYRDILSPQQLDYMMDWMYSTESLERQFAAGHIFFIEDGRGYASFHPDKTAGPLTDNKGAITTFHLEKLYVLPGFQGQGTGRMLFGSIVEKAREMAGGAIRIELNVNRYNKAVTFYEHLGMHKDRSGDFPIGNGYFMNDYIMAVNL